MVSVCVTAVDETGAVVPSALVQIWANVIPTDKSIAPFQSFTKPFCNAFVVGTQLFIRATKQPEYKTSEQVVKIMGDTGVKMVLFKYAVTPPPSDTVISPEPIPTPVCPAGYMLDTVTRRCIPITQPTLPPFEQPTPQPVPPSPPIVMPTPTPTPPPSLPPIVALPPNIIRVEISPFDEFIQSLLARPYANIPNYVWLVVVIIVLAIVFALGRKMK